MAEIVKLYDNCVKVCESVWKCVWKCAKLFFVWGTTLIMHFQYQNRQMRVVLDIFVNGYPTWLKTPLCTLSEDVFYVVLVIHIYCYQKGGRGGCPNISQCIEGGGWS